MWSCQSKFRCISSTINKLDIVRVLGTKMESREKPPRLKDIPTEDMSREQLLQRIVQLEKHVFNLRNVIAKSGLSEGKRELKDKHREQKPLDFTRYNTRHVALKLAYLGWNYQGYAVQEDNTSTIEHELFKALLRTRLIESRAVSNYHRCGRTDKGVSAFSQVVSLSLRTNLLEGRGVIVREGGTAHERKGSKDKEFPYCAMLNRTLPRDIKVLGWCPVEPDFSARFSCFQRTYKYYFPKTALNIPAMQEAASKMVGVHDFRNLCKMDVGNGVHEYIRQIHNVQIKQLSQDLEDSYGLCELTVVGRAFLWHQIRCIVAVLFMVGEGKEQPQIVDTLLDVEKNPRKPQYQMASELPLVLFDCQFEDVDWVMDEENQIKLIQTFQELSTESSVKSAMVQALLGEVNKTKVQDENGEGGVWSDVGSPVYGHLRPLNQDSRARGHKPLMERILCEALEDKIESFAKRRKIATSKEDGGTDSEDSTVIDCDQPDTETEAPDNPMSATESKS